jgi:predicted HTH transcriptional regulator
VLREFTINAFAHADYSIFGSPFRVAYYDDRIEIENPGMFVPGQTVELMKRGVSKIRNNMIANIFEKLGFIENWGYGFRNAISSATELGIQEPDIEEIGDNVRVTIFLSAKSSVLSADNPVLSADSPVLSAENSLLSAKNQVLSADSPVLSAEISAYEGVKIKKSADKIIKYVSVEPKTRTQILEHIGKTNTTRAANVHIKPLLDLGYLYMTEPDKPNSRNQKYYATETGIKSVDNLS